jgi:hypothetical protein
MKKATKKEIINRIDSFLLDDKTIIEECIYYADINPMNIFITSLLLNPNKEYKTNHLKM